MAVQYRLHDVQAVRIVEERGERMLELQTKYVRYQLVLDDDVRRQQMIEALQSEPVRQQEQKKPVKMPQFTKLGN